MKKFYLAVPMRKIGERGVFKMEENKEEKSLELVKTKGETDAGTLITTETTLQDKKAIFNIENGECDVKLNDIVGQTIEICDIFMKKTVSNLKQEDVEINEETGEVINDKKVSLVTILIDKQGIKYVTASKIFAMSVLNLIRTYGIEEVKKGIKIKIIKKSVSNSSNKALGFELV